MYIKSKHKTTGDNVIIIIMSALHMNILKLLKLYVSIVENDSMYRIMPVYLPYEG